MPHNEVKNAGKASRNPVHMRYEKNKREDKTKEIRTRAQNSPLRAVAGRFASPAQNPAALHSTHSGYTGFSVHINPKQLTGSDMGSSVH
jgi:hypothetical protein